MASKELSDAEYQAMAAFRLELRRFLAFSQRAAEGTGLPPQQYQALLAIRGQSGPAPMSITDLAEQLFVRQHTAVELTKRLERAGLVVRVLSKRDKRRVELTLTEHAEKTLQSLAATHLAELRQRGALMADLLSHLQAES